MTQHAQAITSAYACIKRICAEYGNRPIGIVLTQAQETRAKHIFNSLSQVAEQFIGAPLTLLGVIPEDESIKKAQHLGRSVTEAFPRATTSAALKKLAHHLSELSLSPIEMASA